VLAIEGWRDELYLLSRRDAPRHRLLRVNGSAQSLAAARVAVPQGESVIEEFGVARDAIYLKTMVGGVDRLERMNLALLGSKAAEYVRTPFDVAISSW
jgi:prolyl oligopeptidase